MGEEELDFRLQNGIGYTSFSADGKEMFLKGLHAWACLCECFILNLFYPKPAAFLERLYIFILDMP